MRKPNRREKPNQITTIYRTIEIEITVINTQKIYHYYKTIEMEITVTNLQNSTATNLQYP